MARTSPVGLLFAIIGMGNTIVDVAGITLMQRTAADEVLARVFGVLESLMLATLAVGSLVTPAIVAARSVSERRSSSSALVLPALPLPAWPTLRRSTRPRASRALDRCAA